MLLAAAIAVSEGKDIIIVGHSAQYAEDLTTKLYDLLVYLEFPIPVVQGQRIQHQSMHDKTPRDAMEIFVDHYCDEVEA